MAEDDKTPPTITTDPPYELPDEMPSIPDRLSVRMGRILPADKLDLTVETERDSYRSILNVALHGSGHDPNIVCAYLKGFADLYCEENHKGARFRVIAWRDDGRGSQHRKQTQFNVRSPYDEPPLPEEESQPQQASAELTEQQRALNDGWQALTDAHLQHAKTAIEASTVNQAALTKMAVSVAGATPPVSETLEVSQKAYRDGMQAKVDAVETLARFQQDAGVRGQSSPPPPSAVKQILDTLTPLLGPVIQAITVALAQRGQTKASTAQPVAATSKRPAIESTSPAPQVVTLKEPEPPARKPPPPEVETVAVERRDQPVTKPLTLRELAVGLLRSIETNDLVALMNALDGAQRAALQAIANAQTDDDAAQAVVALADALMANPAGLLSMRDLLSTEQVKAFQQLATVCKSHCTEDEPTVEFKREPGEPNSPDSSQAPP